MSIKLGGAGLGAIIENVDAMEIATQNTNDNIDFLNKKIEQVQKNINNIIQNEKLLDLKLRIDWTIGKLEDNDEKLKIAERIKKITESINKEEQIEALVKTIIDLEKTVEFLRESLLAISKSTESLSSKNLDTMKNDISEIMRKQQTGGIGRNVSLETLYNEKNKKYNDDLKEKPYYKEIINENINLDDLETKSKIDIVLIWFENMNNIIDYINVIIGSKKNTTFNELIKELWIIKYSLKDTDYYNKLLSKNFSDISFNNDNLEKINIKYIKQQIKNQKEYSIKFIESLNDFYVYLYCLYYLIVDYVFMIYIDKSTEKKEKIINKLSILSRNLPKSIDIPCYLFFNIYHGKNIKNQGTLIDDVQKELIDLYIYQNTEYDSFFNNTEENIKMYKNYVYAVFTKGYDKINKDDLKDDKS